MTCPHCRDLPELFDEKLARRELRRYRRRGPGRTTRMLVDALRAEDVEGRTLLDIGGGVGAVQHALLEAGVRRVINADAAPTYQTVAREEAARTGTLERIDFHTGDFVELEGAIPAADLVTLDRVLCCYPDMPALVGTSAAHARSTWGAVLPRKRWATGFFIRAFNLFQRARGKAFRAYMHSPEEVERILEGLGFVRAVHRTTLVWQVMVWRAPAA
jgi:magnesium-protoporphyrin O-methyltransferase